MDPKKKRIIFYTIYITLVLLPAVAMLVSGDLHRGGPRDLSVLLGF